jgi:hypothetical protein
MSVVGYLEQKLPHGFDEVFSGAGRKCSLNETLRKAYFPYAAPTIDLEGYKTMLERRGELTLAVAEAVERAERITQECASVVYVSGSLTGADEATKARYGKVSSLVAEYKSPEGKQTFFGYVPHLHGTDPVKHPGVTGREVRNIDFLWAAVVGEAHTTFLDPVCHGSGIELAWAEDRCIPAIGLYPENGKVSRLVLGLDNMNMLPYEEFETDGLENLRGVFDRWHTWIRRYPDEEPGTFFYLQPQALSSDIRRRGVNLDSFSYEWPIEAFDGYVVRGPHQGRVGQVKAHDWHETGDMVINTGGSGEVISVYDHNVELWLRPDFIRDNYA